MAAPIVEPVIAVKTVQIACVEDVRRAGAVLVQGQPAGYVALLVQVILLGQVQVSGHRALGEVAELVGPVLVPKPLAGGVQRHVLARTTFPRPWVTDPDRRVARQIGRPKCVPPERIGRQRRVQPCGVAVSPQPARRVGGRLVRLRAFRPGG
jgi:hypothetical protein